MTTRGRLSSVDVRRSKDRRSFVERSMVVFGHRDITALCIAFERAHSVVEAWVHGTRTPPRDIDLIFELLEAVPRRRWPERWKDAAR